MAKSMPKYNPQLKIEDVVKVLSYLIGITGVLWRSGMLVWFTRSAFFCFAASQYFSNIGASFSSLAVCSH